MLQDELYMKRCLELAANGLGSVAPNPMVGCVIVHDGKVIGEGYHRLYGQAHAEVNAIEAVKEKDLLKQSTLYVNLEPCAHSGKTPPCAKLIASLGVPRVIIATVDPFDRVNGQGIALLKQAGCQVEVGVLAREAEELNRRFFIFQLRKRPYIILKWAQSGDGFLDRNRDKTKESPSWITDETCRILVHKWRTEEQAIMVGTRTALLDNPQLTARSWQGNQPVRILVDRKLAVPKDARIFEDSSEVIVLNTVKQGIEANVHFVKIDFEHLPAETLTELYGRSLQSVIIEGGAYLLRSFIEGGTWDEARIFTGPKDFRDGVKAPPLQGYCLVSEKIGNSRLDIFRNPEQALGS